MADQMDGYLKKRKENGRVNDRRVFDKLRIWSLTAIEKMH